MENSKKITEKAVKPALILEDLLAGINEQNLHGEVDTGSAVGREVW